MTGGGEGIGFFISGDLIIFLWSKNDNNTLEIALQSVAKFKGCGSPNDQPRNRNKEQQMMQQKASPTGAVSTSSKGVLDILYLSIREYIRGYMRQCVTADRRPHGHTAR